MIDNQIVSDALKFQIKVACRFGLKVRAVGSGHSWASLFANKGDIHLNMASFKTLENGNAAEPDAVRTYILRLRYRGCYGLLVYTVLHEEVALVHLGVTNQRSKIINIFTHSVLIELDVTD